MHVVGIVLSVVVLDDKRRALDSIVMRLMEIGLAVPGESDLVDARGIEGRAAIAFDVLGKIFEVLSQKFLNELFLIA